MLSTTTSRHSPSASTTSTITTATAANKKSITSSPSSRARSPHARPNSQKSPFVTFITSPRASVTYTNRGTQYSPTGLPPTADIKAPFRRPVLYPPPSINTSAIESQSKPQPTVQPQAAPPNTQSGALSTTNPSVRPIVAAVSRSDPIPQEPDEPQVRVTPQSSLQNAANSGRRSHSNSADPDTVDSVAKKPKQSQDPASKKKMPADYSKCEPRDLASLISDMLLELIHFNDQIPLRDGHLTRFHSRAPPGISVRDYLNRLTFHATLPTPILLAMVFYIDRLCHYYKAFTINSLTVHRFLIAAATVASKGLSDSFWTNNTYARVGGVSIKELALLELELLSRMEWRIVPQPETLEDYYKSLIMRSDDHEIESTSSDALISSEALTDEQQDTSMTENT